MSEKIKIITEYSPNFRRINLANVYGHVVPNGLETAVYSEEILIDDVISEFPPNNDRSKIKRTIECELLIDPMQMVSIYKWLGKKINDYETLYAKIPTDSEVAERSKILKPEEPK